MNLHGPPDYFAMWSLLSIVALCGILFAIALWQARRNP
jgi:hypothetical protein